MLLALFNLLLDSKLNYGLTFLSKKAINFSFLSFVSDLDHGFFNIK
jgi:hypothetical protein